MTTLEKTTAPSMVWCGHYKSSCKLIAKCCGQEFGCRFCHDNKVETHIMNRYHVEEVVCNKCNMRQPVSNSCKNEKCDNKIFAKYYCDICHLYSDSHICEIYHCEKCNICRICSIGNAKEDYIHCEKCGGCILVSLKDTHKCIANALKGDCCICLESIFLSKEPIKILPCGHTMHKKCLEELLKNNKTSCPLCRKTLLDGEELKTFIQHMDNIIQLNERTGEGVLTKIKCNDCSFNDKVMYHPLGLKCGGCGGYNTILDRSQNTQV